MSPWDVLGWMLVGVVGLVLAVVVLFLIVGMAAALNDEVRHRREVRRRRRERAMADG